MRWHKIKITTEDRLWSEYIRKRDRGICQFCRKVFGWKKLSNCHFKSRGRQSTRYDPENCDSGCTKCHDYMDSHKEEYARWKEEQLGNERYVRLVIRANKNVNRLGDVWKEEFRKHVREMIKVLDEENNYV